jgi:hypothetical protein
MKIGADRLIVADSIDDIKRDVKEKLGTDRVVLAVAGYNGARLTMIDNALSDAILRNDSQFVVVDEKYTSGYQAIVAPYIAGDETITAIGIDSKVVQANTSDLAIFINKWMLSRTITIAFINPLEALKLLYKSLHAAAVMA